MGCARKYTTLLTNQPGAMPISSLSYFTAVIEEVISQSNTSDTYWAYVRRKAATQEREWMTCLRGRTAEPVP